MKNNQKYTREILSEAVSKSHSFAGVLRSLGLRQAGGTHSHVTRMVKRFGLDISHFTGQASNSGAEHKGPRARTPEEILVKRTSGQRQVAFRLRRALIQSGVPYVCSCGQGPLWQGRELRLQVNHKNRDWLDDSRDNLEFLCPNCHSQTEGWCGSADNLSELTSSAKYARARRIKVKERKSRTSGGTRQTRRV